MYSLISITMEITYCMLLLVTFFTLVDSVPYVEDGYTYHEYKRIVNGGNARKDGYPWQVAIMLPSDYEGEPDELLCGGTLITPRHVMTAAHCFGSKPASYPGSLLKDYKNSEFKVLAGEYEMGKKEGREQIMQVSSIYVHEHYQQGDLHANDIAIITLKGAVKSSKFVYPSCLPNTNEDLPSGTECYITGWGKKYAYGHTATILQELKTSLVSNQDCAKRNAEPHKQVTNKMICTGDVSGLKFASGCHGDSGGPLACVNDRQWKVYGVVSWGDAQCSGLNKFTVYTKVNQYLGWIDRHTNKERKYIQCFVSSNSLP